MVNTLYAPPTGGEAVRLSAVQSAVSRLQSAVTAAQERNSELESRISAILTAIQESPNVNQELHTRVFVMKLKNEEINRKLNGESDLAERNEPVGPSISSRVNEVTFALFAQGSLMPTQTLQDSYKLAKSEFETLLPDLKQLIQHELPAIEHELDKAGVPHTPGRMPVWP